MSPAEIKLVVPPGHEKSISHLIASIALGENGCWNFKAATNEWGYGQMQGFGKRMMAHRFAYTVWRGPIPKGWLVCHHCDNPPCVNPEHLFVGDNLANVRDMIKKGRGRAGKHNAIKGKCPSGHEYAGANLVITPDGWRRCLACRTARDTRRKR